MHILLVSDSYPPEIRSISTMVRELAEGFVARGHTVTIMTSYPQYNLSTEAKQTHFAVDTQEGAIRVLRVKTLPHHKVPNVIRGLGQLTLPFFFKRAFRRYVSERVGAVVVYSPPLPLAQFGAWIKTRYGAKYLLNIQDIFPQNAIDLGLLRSSVLKKFFERMESAAYQSADALTTHTEGGKNFIIQKKRVPVRKISVISNWIDTAAYEHARRTGMFRSRFGLEDKFIILFPGVLGPAQNLDYAIEIAREVSNIPEIIFLFVGEGTEKKQLEEKTRRYGLSNVRFESFVSAEQYPALVKDADIGFLCLGSANRTAAVPGKLWGFMAAALPVIGFLNKESEGHNIIRSARCGYAIVPERVEDGAMLLRKMWAEREALKELGKNGYHYVRTHFSKEGCVGMIEKLLIV
ncbi:glycosyltransferase family 4 protein [Candidatus Uhrbacteria bacterium]|nr:glycosyltransferase family 4 protein [Candidatus Uhrbacteria bacterium]